MIFDVLDSFKVLSTDPAGPVHGIVVRDHMTFQGFIGEEGFWAQRTG